MRLKVGHTQIGLLHSLTGAMAISERALLDAEQMAIEEINRDGGVLNRLIEPLIGDGASEPETFSREAQELIASGVNTLFGCWTSASRKAVKPLVEAADGLLWYPVQYEGLEESPNIIYTGSCLNQQIIPAVEWILSNIGARVFLVGSDYVFPRTANLLIRSLVKKQGGRIVGEEYFSLEEQDFRVVIDQIRQGQPSAVISTINGDSNLSFYRQYHAAGIRAEEVPIMAVSAGETEMQPIADLALGHLACWSYFQSFDNAENHQFVARFKKHYGANRVCSDSAIMAYSQIYLWKQAVERAGSFESAKVRSTVVGCETESPAGRITIQSNHHVAKSACVGRLAAGGQFEVMWCTLEPIKPLPWLGLEDIELPTKALIKQSMASFSESIHYSSILEHEMRKRRVLEEAIQLSHDKLEARVRERTLDLENVVQNLQNEILERKRTQEALRESEEKYRNLVEITDTGYLIMDMQSRVVDANAEYVRLTGRQSLNDILGHSVLEWTAPYDLERNEQEVNKCAENGLVRGLVLDYLSPEGHVVPIEINATLVDRADGRVIITVCRDITERKRVEDDILRSKRLSESIINSLPGIFYVFDSKGTFSRVNERFLNVSGYSLEEVLKMRPRDFFSGDEEKKVEDRIKEAFEKGESSVEADFTSKDGKRIRHYFTGYCTTISNDRLLVGVGVDITERTQMELALREAREFLATAMAQSPSAIVIADAPDVTIRMANPAAFDIRGGDPSNLIGIDMAQLSARWQMFRPDGSPYPSKQTPLSRAVLLGEVTPNEDLIIRDEDGNDHWVSAHAAPIRDTAGQVMAGMVVFQDVTEQKQAELAVRESESRYRSLIETMNEGFATHDADYIFTYANARFAEMLGYDAPDEVVGHHYFEFLDEDNRALMRTQIAERRAGRHTRYELAWIAKDGSKVYTLISPCPVFNDDGQFTGSFATLTDITDRKLAEEALHESEHRFRQLFEKANDAIFLLDISETGVPEHFVEVNDLACQRLGYSREELLTMDPADIYTPETLESLPNMMKGILKRGHGTFDVVQATKHGKQIPAEISAHLFELSGKNVLLAIARDVTERKQAEEKLRKSEERFRSLFERAADSFLLHDLNGRFIEVNQAACDYLGYTREELLNLYVSDIVTDYNQPTLEELWRDLIASGPRTVTVIHRRKDGTTLPVEGRLSTFEYRDQVMVLAVVRDITERVHAEDERRALEKHMEEQKRLFYRETLLSVTGGKLDICNDCDITPYLVDSEVAIEVRSAAQISDARHEVKHFCQAQGLASARLDLFMIGVGEAITNAIKHGKAGDVHAGVRNGVVWVGIEDKGPGIESLILPRAVLLRGFSTKPSMGLGYCVMLDVADKVLLKTDERGTLVILEKCLEEQGTDVSIQNLPDTWDSPSNVERPG